MAPYPESLADLHDPPRVLYARGSAATLARPVVAVVGTRRATPYGERVTRGLVKALARAGACIVSGLATGIDTTAHRAALNVGGATCAVLGTGLDVVYPAAHASEHAAIAERGLLLTEYAMGTTARAWAFPRRNRIIAGLAQAVIVVEAGRASGALQTATVALELGRDVAAVPGQIDAAQSYGTNALIRDGAIVITDVTDALLLVGLTAKPSSEAVLSGDEATVWQALGAGRMDADVLAARASLPAARCLAALTTLELAGLVTGELDGTYGRS